MILKITFGLWFVFIFAITDHESISKPIIVQGSDFITEGSFHVRSSNGCQVKNFKFLQIFTIDTSHWEEKIWITLQKLIRINKTTLYRPFHLFYWWRIPHTTLHTLSSHFIVCKILLLLVYFLQTSLKLTGGNSNWQYKKIIMKQLLLY